MLSFLEIFIDSHRKPQTFLFHLRPTHLVEFWNQSINQIVFRSQRDTHSHIKDLFPSYPGMWPWLGRRWGWQLFDIRRSIILDGWLPPLNVNDHWTRGTKSSWGEFITTVRFLGFSGTSKCRCWISPRLITRILSLWNMTRLTNPPEER